jgi:hypothetical protein
MSNEQASQILRALGRIEGRIDGVLEEQRRIASYTTATSARVGELEREQSRWKGWMAGIAATVSAVVAALVRWI